MAPNQKRKKRKNEPTKYERRIESINQIRNLTNTTENSQWIYIEIQMPHIIQKKKNPKEKKNKTKQKQIFFIKKKEAKAVPWNKTKLRIEKRQKQREKKIRKGGREKGEAARAGGHQR